MSNCQGFNRRAFFGSVAAAGIGGAALLASDSSSSAEDAKNEPPKSFTASFPLLQNVSETSASIAWALNCPATGWVEWGTTPALGKIARNSEFGLNPFETDFISARINGLAPNTKYYYRTATCSFTYKTAYDKTASEPQYSDIYSFETSGSKGDETTFAVMNDTHNTLPTIRGHLKRVKELNSDLLFWNGDLCSDYMNPEHVKENIANPNDEPYAAERPLIFVPGNHDRRGKWVRNLKNCLTTWRQDDPAFYELGYNYAFRKGPVAFVVLDTGEDKPDWHPAWTQMANYEPYRELQAAWLAKVLERPEIKSAPYLIALCHIPLYSPNPKANPGNILDQFATIQWPARQMWGPLFEKYGVQLLIAAHLHSFGYSEPTADRPWAQIVGGGPAYDNAFLIHGKANKDNLTLVCEKISDQKVAGTWTYKPRV